MGEFVAKWEDFLRLFLWKRDSDCAENENYYQIFEDLQEEDSLTETGDRDLAVHQVVKNMF